MRFLTSRFLLLKRLCKWHVYNALIVLSVLTLGLANSNLYAGEHKTVEKKYEFNIPTQPLHVSLNQLSDLAKISFLFPYELVVNKTGRSVQGHFTIQQALNLLLDEHSLVGELTNKEAFLIQPSNNINMESTNMTTKKTLLASILATMFSSTSVYAAENNDNTNDDTIETIKVTGVKRSIQQSLNDKRFSTEIKDTISAEDIGQLPDENIGEALQRVTGIQMGRADDGEGAKIQIRGISDNNVEINGQTLVGTSAGRGVNFQDLPSELFSGIEVLKAPTAELTEGSLGGTINLKTRRALELKDDTVFSVSAKAKYKDSNEQTDSDLSLFLGKKFEDTAIGDFGFTIALGTKKVASYTESFNGDNSNAATWTRKYDEDTIDRTSREPDAGLEVGEDTTWWRSDAAIAEKGIDLDGDGVDEPFGSAAYYMQNSFVISTEENSSKRDSLAVSFQWAPSDNIKVFFDSMYTKNEDTNMRAENHAMRLFRPTGFPLLAGLEDSPERELNPDLALNTYEKIADGKSYFVARTDENGNPVLDENGNQLQDEYTRDIYYMTKGVYGGVNARIGTAPSSGASERELEKYAGGIEYQVTDQLLLESEFTMSKGSTRTDSHGFDLMYEWGNNGFFNPNDWTNIVSFDLTQTEMPTFTMYRSPWYDKTVQNPDDAGAGKTLVPFESMNLAEENLVYTAFSRNSRDTESEDNSVKLDLTYEFYDGILTHLKMGVRGAERSFENTGYSNRDQNKNRGLSTYTYQDEDGNEVDTGKFAEFPNSYIRVNPDGHDTRIANGTALDSDKLGDEQFKTELYFKGISEQLEGCFDVFTTDGAAGRSGSASRSLISDTCSSDFYTNAFNMLPLRTNVPHQVAPGATYYESYAGNYTVNEDTTAFYIKADLELDVMDMPLFGNVGVRYVETETEAFGYVDATPEQQAESGFSKVKASLVSEYDHVLPSVNLNLQVTDQFITRFAAYKAIKRPGITDVTPRFSVNIDGNGSLTGFDASGSMGNPNLKPVEADNLDLSFEYYYGQSNLLAFTAFYN